jgi:hypothetical protein
MAALHRYDHRLVVPRSMPTTFATVVSSTSALLSACCCGQLHSGELRYGTRARPRAFANCERREPTVRDQRRLVAKTTDPTASSTHSTCQT